MASYSPELVAIMRAALEEVMTRIPGEQATQSVKAQVGRSILKAAGEGLTTYDGLVAAAMEQVQVIVSILT